MAGRGSGRAVAGQWRGSGRAGLPEARRRYGLARGVSHVRATPLPPARKTMPRYRRGNTTSSILTETAQVDGGNVQTYAVICRQNPGKISGGQGPRPRILVTGRPCPDKDAQTGRNAGNKLHGVAKAPLPWRPCAGAWSGLEPKGPPRAAPRGPEPGQRRSVLRRPGPGAGCPRPTIKAPCGPPPRAARHLRLHRHALLDCRLPRPSPTPPWNKLRCPWRSK